MNISVIEYEHRDSGNWKTFDYFYVKGELKLEQISKYMIGTEFFYPKVVGIPPLDPDNVFAGCPEFHDITDIRPFDPNRDALPEKNLKLLISAPEMIKRFKRHKKIARQLTRFAENVRDFAVPLDIGKAAWFAIAHEHGQNQWNRLVGERH